MAQSTTRKTQEETRRLYLDIAREEFAEHGYAEASTSRIVQKSGMARGSLYYHFGDKNGLFMAVFQDVLFGGHEMILERTSHIEDPWESVKKGAHIFLDLCMERTYRKIVLIESQAAINFKERFACHQKTLLGRFRELLPELLQRGYFPGHTQETILIFMFGILSEIGRAMDSSKDIEKARKTFGHAFDQTLILMEPRED